MDKDVINRHLWFGIYLFGAILFTGLFIVLLFLNSINFNVQHLNKIKENDIEQSLNVPLAFKIDISQTNINLPENLTIVNIDDIARQFESTLELPRHSLSFSLIKLKRSLSNGNSRKHRSIEDDQSLINDRILAVQAAIHYSLCENIDDCKRKLHNRFIRSTESNENGSLPINLHFDNGIQVTATIRSYQSDQESTQKSTKTIDKNYLNKCSKSKLYNLFDASIKELQNGLTKNHFTSVDLVKAYIARINEVNLQGPTLRAVLEISPTALEAAEKADALRKKGKILSPLHGIPILVKDSIATRPEDGMNTTAGSFALLRSITPGDSTVVKKLREAGAIIFGKTSLSEWGNFRSFTTPNGWSGRGKQATSPFYPQGDACGSSTGSAVASSIGLAAGTLGTETDGSIMCPSNRNNVVGIKPTVGLVSRNLVIPLSRNQDTIGPICRSVADAAAILSVIAGRDSADNYTLSQPEKVPDYTKHLKKNGLKGARIGVLRKLFTNSSLFGYPDYIVSQFNRVIEDVFKKLGANIIDSVDLETTEQLLFRDSELTVLLFDFKYEINQYLSKLVSIPTNVTSLLDLINYNNANPDLELPPGRNDQELFYLAQTTTNFQEPAYINALATNIELGRTRGIDATLNKYNLDALIAPADGFTSVHAALAGYPMITVPLGFLPENTPVNTNENTTLFNLPIWPAPNFPFGISFIGTAYSEARLIELAYSFEQATLISTKGKPFKAAIPNTQLSDIVCQNKPC